ncbi:MAG: element excision factor XisH family protein [Microcoleaceae cyanobacterium MO_207.B10]|nr:element excision factor XisH family protein [Microcoleaceae cyanobacterium MO_207.B10]
MTPFFFKFGGVNMYVDLGAEKLVGAEKDGKKIAVEVKSFIQKLITYEFHTPLSQYLNYRFILNQKDPERILYLAVPEDTYKTFFRLLFTQ